MSRINDALKRISESDKSASPPSPAPVAPSPQIPRKSSTPFLALVGIALALVIVGLGLFFRPTHAPATPTPNNTVAAPVPKTLESVAPVATPALPPKPTVAQIPAQPLATPATNVPPQFPALKIQAIFFTPAHPQAMINRQTISEGDSVAGVRIKQISPDHVTAEWDGQVRIFHLNGQ